MHFASLLGLAVALVPLASSCTSWRPVERHESWTLYARPNAPIDVERFSRVLEPAFAAVEHHFGPFEAPVNIHAMREGDASRERASAKLESVPGIGAARVRAFHVRPSGNPFAASGVFLETADVGTAVHELVHARLAEEPDELPLWFEEGLASFLGDGAMHAGRWTVDGLCCWPLRELRGLALDDRELHRLLRIGAGDESSSRDNLLVHFVGWAIVFDLAREAPDQCWHDWYATWQRNGSLADARRRLQRTLAEGTDLEWLGRLSSDDPAVRLAAAKGTWKLRSRDALGLLLDRLDQEDDPDVRLTIALNALITAGETRIGGRTWRRLARSVFPTLREAELAQSAERAALDIVLASMRSRVSESASQNAFDALSHYWDE